MQPLTKNFTIGFVWVWQATSVTAGGPCPWPPTHSYASETINVWERFKFNKLQIQNDSFWHYELKNTQRT